MERDCGPEAGRMLWVPPTSELQFSRHWDEGKWTKRTLKSNIYMQNIFLFVVYLLVKRSIRETVESAARCVIIHKASRPLGT